MAQEKCGGSSVSACVFLLASCVSSRFCCRVSAGVLLLARFCWRVFAGAFLLAHFCWRVSAGALLLARFCWRALAGTYLLARFCWRLFLPGHFSVEAFCCRAVFLACFSWRVFPLERFSAGTFFVVARIFRLVHVVRCCLFVLTLFLCWQRCSALIGALFQLVWLAC